MTGSAVVIDPSFIRQLIVTCNVHKTCRYVSPFFPFVSDILLTFTNSFFSFRVSGVSALAVTFRFAHCFRLGFPLTVLPSYLCSSSPHPSPSHVLLRPLLIASLPRSESTISTWTRTYPYSAHMHRIPMHRTFYSYLSWLAAPR